MILKVADRFNIDPDRAEDLDASTLGLIGDEAQMAKETAPR